jgi:hypothetical protein
MQLVLQLQIMPTLGLIADKDWADFNADIFSIRLDPAAVR